MSNPDRPGPGFDPLSQPRTTEGNGDVFNLGTLDKSKLTPIAAEAARGLPRSIIVTGEDGEFYAYERVADSETPESSSAIPNAEQLGEPLSAAIPSQFIDAYYQSLLNMGIRAPEAQRVCKKFQADANAIRRYGNLDTSGANAGITQKDLPSGNQIDSPLPLRRPHTRKSTKKSLEIGNMHLGEVIEDPIGHMLWTITTTAELYGVPLEMDEATAIRIAKIHPKRK